MRPHRTRPKSPTYAPQELRLAVDVPAGTIRVAGELDRSSAHHLADALSALRSSPSPTWTLDLEGLTFCDVEGMRVLTRAVRLAHSCGRGLHLTRIQPAVADLLVLGRSEPEDPVAS